MGRDAVTIAETQRGVLGLAGSEGGKQGPSGATPATKQGFVAPGDVNDARMATPAPAAPPSDGSTQQDKGLCYDEIKIADWPTIYLRSGSEHYVEELVRHFPGERATIERWVALCKDCSAKDLFFDLKIARPAWLARAVNWVASRKFFAMTKKTALEMAQEVTPNAKLQAALLGQFGDYGLAPSKEPVADSLRNTLFCQIERAALHTG